MFRISRERGHSFRSVPGIASGQTKERGEGTLLKGVSPDVSDVPDITRKGTLLKGVSPGFRLDEGRSVGERRARR